MTRLLKKKNELFFVERAAELLGKRWCLENHEHPDFIVTEGMRKFGLEVCEIFAGEQIWTNRNRPAGFRIRRKESETQQAIDKLRQDYELQAEVALVVQFVGDMCGENLDGVLPTLFALNLATKPVCYRDDFYVDKGPARLHVYITRAFQANWFSVGDRVGWVNRSPIDRIAKATEAKAKKLPQYKKSSGLYNIRLLIVANRILNSGKLALLGVPPLDVHGFEIVYFFSYPQFITIFDGARHISRVPK